jgi:hypothetical protein
MSTPEKGTGSSLLAAFAKLGSLVSNQTHASGSFDAKDHYGDGEAPDLIQRASDLFAIAFKAMALGKEEKKKNKWEFSLKMKGKGVVEPLPLYGNLRLLSDDDVLKVRLFCRFVGQQLFSTSVDDFFAYQESKLGEMVNPFYKRFAEQAGRFVATFGQEIEIPAWPTERVSGPERDTFVRKANDWLTVFRAMPGIKDALDFFQEENNDVFNAFFHLQRQFDSPNYKDFDEEKNPYPQPLPRIAAYRNALEELQAEFTSLEGSVGMCFDYCKMSTGRVVDFVLSAEDTFLNITTRLDRDYPLELDHSHQLMHFRANDVKMMMFPLRCLFFEELDARRGTKDSNDNTLDSYMDMTLGATEIHIPESYEHSFQSKDLEEDLQKALNDLTEEPVLPDDWKTSSMIQDIQKLSHHDLEEHAKIFDALSDTYEEKYKTDENNISRRLARVAYLYLKAMAKKDVMAKASQARLDNIESMAFKYAEHASKFAEVEITPESDLRGIKDDQLPLMASPEQMEDLFRTSRIVARLGETSEEFAERAQQIEAGLQAALAMMKQAGDLMQTMVKRMFPNTEDSADLLEAIQSLIDLSYKTQQALTDLAKKEGSSSKDKKVQAELERLKKEVAECKAETSRRQGELKTILGSKRELVASMRVTQAEKDYNNNQLRMITMMTINSMQNQKT